MWSLHVSHRDKKWNSCFLLHNTFEKFHRVRNIVYWRNHRFTCDLSFRTALSRRFFSHGRFYIWSFFPLFLQVYCECVMISASGFPQSLFPAECLWRVLSADSFRRDRHRFESPLTKTTSSGNGSLRSVLSTVRQRASSSAATRYVLQPVVVGHFWRRRETSHARRTALYHIKILVHTLRHVNFITVHLSETHVCRGREKNNAPESFSSVSLCFSLPQNLSVAARCLILSLSRLSRNERNILARVYMIFSPPAHFLSGLL